MTVRQIVTTFLRGAKQAGQGKQDIGREAVVELIQKAAAKQSGIRRGWQVKAASWVKKVHVDRGDVKIGRLMPGGRFAVDPALLPRYLVPEDLEKFELKPYVEIPAPKKAEEKKAEAQS